MPRSGGKHKIWARTSRQDQRFVQRSSRLCDISCVEEGEVLQASAHAVAVGATAGPEHGASAWVLACALHHRRAVAMAKKTSKVRCCYGLRACHTTGQWRGAVCRPCGTVTCAASVVRTCHAQAARHRRVTAATRHACGSRGLDCVWSCTDVIAGAVTAAHCVLVVPRWCHRSRHWGLSHAAWHRTARTSDTLPNAAASTVPSSPRPPIRPVLAPQAAQELAAKKRCVATRSQSLRRYGAATVCRKGRPPMRTRCAAHNRPAPVRARACRVPATAPRTARPCVWWCVCAPCRRRR